jgi:hypothetical protein
MRYSYRNGEQEKEEKEIELDKVYGVLQAGVLQIDQYS